MEKRSSYKNPDIIEVYENFLKIGFNTSEIKTMNHNLFDSYKLMGDIQFEEKPKLMVLDLVKHQEI